MSYCGIDDIRAEGIAEEQMTDDQVSQLIALACDYIDKVTGQWFEPRQKTVKLDGRGGQVLQLPVFLINCDEIEVDGIPVDDYVLFNRISPEDDRNYPKIWRRLRWPKGVQNIQIQGEWGYVEEDGTTPLLIKRAAIKLCLYNFPALGDSEAQEEKDLRGKIRSETTDGHSYTLDGSSSSSGTGSSLSTGDSEIDGILQYFMRPRFMMAIV